MEILIQLLLGIFNVQLLQGLLVNRLDAIVIAPILENVVNNLTQKDKHSSQELEKALNLCFLSALQTIVRESHKELIGLSIIQRYRGVTIYPPEHREDLQWLDWKLKQLIKDIKQVKRLKHVDILLQSIEEIVSLLTPEGELLVKEKLIAIALKNDSVPECYAAKIKASLFEKLCDNFAAEINHNPGLRDIIQLKVLVNINNKLAGNQLKIPNLEKPVHSSEARRRVKLEFDIEKLDAARLEAIEQHLQTVLGDSSIKLRRIEEGSMELYFDGSEKGMKKLDALFKSGELKEILDIPVQSVDSDVSFSEVVVNLSQWLQNIIVAGWQTVEEVLGTETNKLVVARSAVGSEGIIRAQRIDLETEQTSTSLALTVAIQPQANDNRKISLELYPIGNTTLPLSLKCLVLDTSEQVIKQVQTEKPERWIRIDINGKTTEYFRLKIEFGDFSTIRSFVI
ncbi:DUF1822 family protein [Calothrix sp. PCC 7507]|uniref:DUF1822 family protein n=1 Tax=Calothrix sp. PCC 7507 TaxID=99598 RepID=UPI00029EC9A4|nr:DUF1822 family protein [Calothrix sp. PCC 7507]AFY32895.1 protein of unknown function DUF1822 [Calothrix sp. PCC 7507]